MRNKENVKERSIGEIESIEIKRKRRTDEKSNFSN